MADSNAQEDAAKVASHTQAFLRSLDRKMDLVPENQARHTERLGRLERDVADVRRDLTEIRSDIALLENKTLSAQTEIVSILYRLEQAAAPSIERFEAASPAPWCYLDEP
jgi:multidrug resistance efflux pump